MNALAHKKLLYAPLLLTLAQALVVAFLLSSVNLGTEGGDLCKRFIYLATSFSFSILVEFFIRTVHCSERAIALLAFVSCIAFSSVFGAASGPACIVQSSRFIFFSKIRLHLSLLLNLLNCAVLSCYITIVHRKITSCTSYADTNGIFAHLGDSMGFITRESRLVLAIGFVMGLVFLLAGVLVVQPLLNYFHFLLRFGLFYSSALELLTNFIFMNLSNWAYITITGVLAAAFVYNSSVMPYEDEKQLSRLHAGRLALHKLSTASAHASQTYAKHLSEYIESEFIQANAILDDIQAAATQYENSAFVNVPQINKSCSNKIRSYGIGSYVSACWAYQAAMLILPLQYHAVSFSLCRILLYFTKSQSQVVRRDAALQRVPAMFEGLLERERSLEKRCSIDLESQRIAHFLKLLSSL